MSIDQTSRRDFLKLTSGGVSAATLSSLINNVEAAAMPEPTLHHAAKAKSVILLYMSGGVSHVDSFDPKPLLKERHGQPMPVALERTQFDKNGNIMASPWEIGRYGESGLEMMIDSSNKKVREKYTARFDKVGQEFKQNFARSKSDTLLVEAGTSYIRVLHHFFKKRSK